MRDIIEAVQGWLQSGETGIAVATVIRTFNSAPRRPGAKMAISANGRIAGSVSGGCIEAAIIEESAEMTEGRPPKVLHFEPADERAWQVGLPCGGSVDVLLEPLQSDHFRFLAAQLEENERAFSVTIIRGPRDLLGKKVTWSRSRELRGTVPSVLAKRLASAAEGLTNAAVVTVGEGLEAFVEVFQPAPTLVMVGGVHIAVALARLARILGYRTVVVDPRRTFGSAERFPDVDRLLQVWPEEAYAAVGMTPETAVAVLTHDPKLDEPALAGALRGPAFYVGALGSSRNQEKRRERLRQQGFSDSDLARIRGPIGLDIGAATPEEIALSILAQIVAQSRGTDSARRAGAMAALHAAVR